MLWHFSAKLWHVSAKPSLCPGISQPHLYLHGCKMPCTINIHSKHMQSNKKTNKQQTNFTQQSCNNHKNYIYKNIEKEIIIQIIGFCFSGAEIG
jgi:hypothetical protein